MATEKVICDTDVIIDYLDDKRTRWAAATKILENEIGLDNLVISAITKIELIAGVSNKTDLRILNQKINRFDVFLINPAITTIAIHLIENYKLSHGLALPDAFIASTSLHTNLELFTYNVKDYKFIAGLQLYKFDS